MRGKRKLGRRIAAGLMAVLLAVGTVPMDWTSIGVQIANAAEYTLNSSDNECYTQGDWVATEEAGYKSQRTTTWDFTKNSSNQTLEADDYVDGILISDIGTTGKGTKLHKDGYFDTYKGTFVLPLSGNTDKVALTYVNQSGNNKRTLTVGDNQTAVLTLTSNTVTGTYEKTTESAAGYFSTNGLKIVAGTNGSDDSGELKATKITIIEYSKTQEPSSGDTDNGDENDDDDYIVDDELQEMKADDAAEVGTFTPSSAGIFEKESPVNDDVIYSKNAFIKLSKSSDCANLYLHASHGLMSTDNKPITFEVIVPAEKVGEFSIKACGYGGSKATVTINGKAVGQFKTGVSVSVNGNGRTAEEEYTEAVSIKDTSTKDDGSVADNGSATVFKCTNTSSKAVRMTITVEKDNGDIYIHNVSYAVSNIPTQTCDVNVTLANDILSNATDETLTYTFTNGTVEKKFTASQMKSGKIQLEAGTYTVSLSGDAIDKAGSDYKVYELADASRTLTVSATETNSYIVSLTQVTKWLFGNTTGFKGLYQYNKVETGYYKGISISASVDGAKLNTLNNDGSENTSRNTNAQFNAGTILSVPVAGACKIKVTMNSTYAYTIDGMAVNKAEFTYVYPGNAGMVNIVSTASDYIVSIEILDDTVDTVSASGTVSLANSQTLPSDLKDLRLVFTNTAAAGQVYYADVNISDGSYALNLPSTEAGAAFNVTLDTTAYAVSTGGSVTAKNGTNIEQNITIRENIARNITLEIKGDETPNLNADGVEIVFTNVDDKNDVTRASYGSDIKLYDGTYRVTIEGENYHTQGFKLVNTSLNLTVSADTTFTLKFEKATSWKFNATTTSEDDYYAQTINTGSEGYYNGLHIVTASLHTHYENGKGGKLSARTSDGDTQANSDTVIYVPVTGAGTVTVETKSGKGYGQYVTIGEGDAAVTGAAGSDSVSYKYTGTAAAMIPVTILDGLADDGQTAKVISVYLQSISVTYAGDDTADAVQTKMPSVDDGKLVASVAGGMSVDAAGQKLNITQTGGTVGGSGAAPSGVSYYVFPATTDYDTLEFDAVVTGGSSNAGWGFFGGLFSTQCQYTICMRKASTSLRAIKSNSTELTSYTNASGSEYTITMGTKVHYTITRTDEKAVITATFTDANGVSQVTELSQSFVESGAEYYYGFAVTSASATVTNMVYKSSDGTVYYSQNDAYAPKGTAPKVTSVTAVTRTGTNKSDTIKVSWEGDEAEDDGYYELQVKIDDGEWTTVATDIVDKSYDYKIGPATTHTYEFRVYGVLGKANKGGSTSDAFSVKMDGGITGALAAPVVTATAGTSSITLTWDKDSNAKEYWVYRYSYDEGAANAKKVATVVNNTYIDSVGVTAEMPYYYYVSAKSTDNSSDYSETVWAMITTTAAHTGTYVYEDEATEIFITDKSYDTVFSGNATLKGSVYGVGTLTVSGGSGAAQTQEISASGDSFEFTIPLNEGRNDVNLVFTDKNGKMTRKTYNFVYLTNYNKLVDPDFGGNNGEANEDGVPTYKTIQAAVESVSSDNAERVVILVKAGSYEERLVVNVPNVTIIGQDRESTSVHYYPGSLGGKTEERCAIYIKDGAAGFSAENISFANDYVYGSTNQSNQSADALRVDADEASFVNVKISGVQDTLYMDKGNQYYYKCRIEGVVDYIYSGEKARALFDDCELVFLYNANKTSGYVCAPKTSTDAAYGLTFYNCVVTAEEGCNGTGYLLARPWGADAYITWINCYIGKAINATLPYSDMSPNSYKKARFYEYGSYGPGFAVNSDRRQISSSKAAEMMTDGYLGWAPRTAVSTIGGKYVGSIETKRISDNIQSSTRVVNTYEQTDGDDSGLARYTQEGFASVYGTNGVTGGGLQKVDDAANNYDNLNYYEVTSATEFLEALVSVKKNGKAAVINLTADVNLGSIELGSENLSKYSSVIKAYAAQAITHPTLMKTGVSVLTISDMYNLTIMSSNGSAIKHANITMKNSSNIIIRNIVFDELWEWDESTKGDYDRNDWDYMTLDSGTNGVWIDHCTFYKAYDGVIDIKNPNPTDNVTISWCEFLPASAGYVYGVDSAANDATFFGIMMKELKDNAEKYPYYQSLIADGMTHQQVIGYAYGQKKTHLLGQSAESTNAVGINATFANNYYKDSMDRMPRLRYGTAHVYNCVLDAQDLFTIKASITNKEVAKHIVSNGVSSTCDGQILVENSYINGIVNALNSGNGSDTSGYIDAVNSLYYINGVRYKLEPKVNTTKVGEVVKKTDASAFRTALGYSYNLRDAASLYTTVVPYTGAGKLNMTVLQWEKNVYNVEYVSEGDTGTYTNDGLPDSPYSESSSSDGGSDDGAGNGNGDDGSGNGSGSGNENAGNGNENAGSGSENGGSGSDDDGSGNVSGGADENGSGNVNGGADENGSGNVSGGSDDIYNNEETGSGAGSDGAVNGGANADSGADASNTGAGSASGDASVGGSDESTTPISEVLTAEDIPGAQVVTIDGAAFTQLGDVAASTENVMQAVNEDGRITTNEPVSQTTENLAQAILEQIEAGAEDFYVFASENADVSPEVIEALVDSGKSMSVGIVSDDGKVKTILTLDGSALEKSDVRFNLKVTIDPQGSNAETLVSGAGFEKKSYTVVDFDYSGDLPGVFKVAVDVSDKYADGTQLALYYNNREAGRLENQYQITSVRGGFAEFAIAHCSEYVLISVSDAGSNVAVNALSSPVTGDTNNIALWAMLMGLAIAAYFGIKAAQSDKKRAR